MSVRTDGIVFRALLPTGVPGTRNAWPIDARPNRPRFTYRLESGGEIHADGGNYSAMPRYSVTLELDEHDDDLIETFEAAIAELGPYSYSEGYDEKSGAFTYEWDFTMPRCNDD